MKKKIGFIVLIIIFIIGLVIINKFLNIEVKKNDLLVYGESENIVSSNENQNEEIESKVIYVTEETFENEVLNSNKIVLLDFYADWCSPCRILEPVIEVIAEENEDIKVVKVDVDTCPNLAEKYEAYSIPTLVVVKDGEEINRMVGVDKKTNIVKMIRESDNITENVVK